MAPLSVAKKIGIALILIAATASTSWANCVTNTILFPKLLICTTCCHGNSCTTSCV